MIIEKYRGGNAVPVYRRLRESGRRIPAGLEFVSSWVTEDLSRCYQVMECRDRDLLDEWMSLWTDLVHFEVVPVVTSAEAASRMEDQL